MSEQIEAALQELASVEHPDDPHDPICRAKGFLRAALAFASTKPSDADVAERIAQAIEAAGTAIETAQREVHRGYLPIVESGIVAGYSQAARIARTEAGA